MIMELASDKKEKMKGVTGLSEYRLPYLQEADTISLGRKIGALLFPGAFIALYGDLGTGKTTFTRALASGLGVKEDICSPSYNILMEYDDGRLPLYHFDAYRLKDVSELIDIGYIDYCYNGGVVIMEWADKVEEALPRDRLDIHIIGSGTQFRTMLFVPHGSSYTDILKETVI